MHFVFFNIYIFITKRRIKREEYIIGQKGYDMLDMRSIKEILKLHFNNQKEVKRIFNKALKLRSHNNKLDKKLINFIKVYVSSKGMLYLQKASEYGGIIYVLLSLVDAFMSKQEDEWIFRALMRSCGIDMIYYATKNLIKAIFIHGYKGLYQIMHDIFSIKKNISIRLVKILKFIERNTHNLRVFIENQTPESSIPQIPPPRPSIQSNYGNNYANSMNYDSKNKSNTTPQKNNNNVTTTKSSSSTSINMPQKATTNENKIPPADSPSKNNKSPTQQ